jgi:hypothetical protein
LVLYRVGDFTRREFLKTTVGAAGARFIDVRRGVGAGEVLYNGITLADPWPPRNRVLDDVLHDPAYLNDPPAVIPIDLGRQLFVDDFLIEENTLNRVFHRARYHPDNPILRPATDWERRDEYADRTGTPSNPAAMVFSDGVFYDPTERVYKMWYMGGYLQHTCLALSHDGVTWERPSLDYVRGTNIVYSDLRDSNTVWLDLSAADRASRYKMASFNGSENAMLLFESPDGIHWRRVGRTGPSGDRSTLFWNPFRNVWVFSLRTEHLGGPGRFRRYWESRDFATTRWREGEPLVWVKADALDPRRPELNVQPELYTLDCVAYESLILGLFTIFRGERNDREKPNDICVGFSRDGFHWSRPDRRPFLGVSDHVGDWNWANVQSAGGCCLVVGDELYFYVSGRRGRPGTNLPGVCSTGLATLRRDGFASLTDARDDQSAARPVAFARPARTVTTRPLRFSGQRLFVNAEASAGELRAEVLDRGGRVIAPFSRERCVPVAGDSTRREVSWQGPANLGELRGETVRLRFSVTRGHLFSFWVTNSPGGASHGYPAAGGPGFAGATDE